jgi:hypothetical protein
MFTHDVYARCLHTMLAHDVRDARNMHEAHEKRARVAHVYSTACVRSTQSARPTQGVHVSTQHMRLSNSMCV